MIEVEVLSDAEVAELDDGWEPPHGQRMTPELIASRLRVGVYLPPLGEREAELLEALTSDPLGDGAVAQRRVRPVVASVVAAAPGAVQLCEVVEVITVANSAGAEAELSGREWLELVGALDRCSSFLEATKHEAVAALDRRLLQERPGRALRRDSRRAAADQLAPLLKVSPAAASYVVGLARQCEQMPMATEALAAGRMTPAQLRVLAAVLKRIPDEAARAQVETTAVRAAEDMTRARLADAVEEAALQADPGYAARRTAQGVLERDVRLVPSPVPGCKRVLADLELVDAASLWQVLQQVARSAKDATAADEHAAEERTLPQLRADALVSIIVGLFAPTAADRDAALAGLRREGGLGEGADADGEGDEVDDAGAEHEVSDLPPDTRGPVPIPTPEQRATLAEVHVVVLADDIDDAGANDDRPCDRPDDDGAPGDGAPGDGAPGASSVEDDPPAGSQVVPENGWQPRRPSRRRHDRLRALALHGPFGYVPGLGRLAPSVTRDVLARAPWRRLVADPVTGVLLRRSRWRLVPGAGAAGSPQDRRDEQRNRLARLRDTADDAPPGVEVQYRPSSVLAAFVRARDATCIGPACHHGARSGGIQLDHTIAWGTSTPTRSRGGRTEPGNLGCVCQRLHTAKTHGGWQLAQPSPGRFVWTSPLGRVWHRRATPLLPDLLSDVAV